MLCTVVGARPNFIKMAPIVAECSRRGLAQVFVHTGQHYDRQMSQIFFDELGMPQPDVYLGVGSGSHAEQTAKILTAFEATCLKVRPHMVVVVGDVNSTLACALAAAKLNIPVAHVEAGLRSFDRSMPEEINRIMTDHLSSVLFTTEKSGNVNLAIEGVPSDRVHFVGNTMIDSLYIHLEKAVARMPWQTYGYQPGCYGVVTLHRPSNVDDPAIVHELAAALCIVAHDLPLIFPIHPRTFAHSAGIWEAIEGLKIVEPLGYLEFLGLMARARLVITDSGGIQEETTALKIPCVTIRHNTERPVTLSEGTNRLVEPIADAIVEVVQTPSEYTGGSPELWDGKAAERIVDILESLN